MDKKDEGNLNRWTAGLSDGAKFKDQPSSKDIVGQSSLSSPLNRRSLVTTLLICFCNLINLMDRFTIPGILPMLISDLHLSHFQGGLLQSGFVVSYVISAPFVGYLADRYSRKNILIAGLTVWSVITMASSFATSFESLMIFRCFGGIGEATYSAIGRAVIGDLFVGSLRSKMLALFYFTTPIGGGLGFITASMLANAFGSWNWGLRLVPMMSFLSIILITLFLSDPPRGESDGSQSKHNSSLAEDLWHLITNPSFMLSTFGSVAVSFCVGAFGAWGPVYFCYTRQLANNYAYSFESISIIFGVVSILSGLLGVLAGWYFGQKARSLFVFADAAVSGVGLLCSSSFLYVILSVPYLSTNASFVLAFFGFWFINWNWPLVGDIMLSVVSPTRRVTAGAFQTLLSHVLGDASSPFIIGIISDAFKLRSEVETARNNRGDFQTLEHAFYLVLGVQLLGALFFFACSFFLRSDRAKERNFTPDKEVC